jgi:hypothetical protein
LKIFILLALSVFMALPAFAATLVTERAAQYELNKASPGAMAKWTLGTALISNRIHIAKAKYDFAVQGGAIGTGNLVGENGKPVVLPNKAVIVDCLIDVLTAGTTSASGTLALNSQGAGDLKAALAAASWTGRLACIPVGTAATVIKLTADRTLQYTIATGALTAGKVWVYVYYILGGE